MHDVSYCWKMTIYHSLCRFPRAYSRRTFFYIYVNVCMYLPANGTHVKINMLLFKFLLYTYKSQTDVLLSIIPNNNNKYATGYAYLYNRLVLVYDTFI